MSTWHTFSAIRGNPAQQCHFSVKQSLTETLRPLYSLVPCKSLMVGGA